ncbi:MAG: Eco57I restriction-modification methylase domain-containing protein [Methanophagales archaeon]|nr:Eco57I restriction-modification methylase domain-containing protein [Methanophagales archaeon]
MSNPNDKSGVGRIAYFMFDEYLDSDKFDAIYDVFSKEGVLKGSFDRYAESTKGKKGTAEVDSEFLKDYEFSVLGVEILGNVYEQFLGKVIRLTAGHQAKVETKPEGKKAVFQVRENERYLTTAEKKRILLNNIFGVDTDPQAVEVTKLSLLLKVPEHESRESIDQQVKLKEWAPTEVEFYKKHYASASKGNYDIYVVFVERALQLLNVRGRMGYILPHKFFQAKYGKPLRELIAGTDPVFIMESVSETEYKSATTGKIFPIVFSQGSSSSVYPFSPINA